MRRSIALISSPLFLTIAALAALVGCGSSTSNPDGTGQTVSADAGDNNVGGGFSLCGCTSEDAGCVEPKDIPVNSPAQCQTDSDCKADEACTAEFADTLMCSKRCDPNAADAAVCPSGFTCESFVP